MGRAYDFFIIDAQYYLRRNWYIISQNQEFNKYELMTSVLMTIFKIYKMYGGRKIILLWDKKPYIKEDVIKNYKGDRYLVVEDKDNKDARLNELKLMIQNPQISEEDKAKYLEEINKLEQELIQLAKDVELFNKLGAAKYEFLCNFNKFGLVSLQIKGYEADDLAYLCGQWCKNHNMTALLVSGDSDWSCMTNENVDVLRFTKNYNDLYDINKSKESVIEEFRDQISPFEFYQINDIYNGGHNNVVLEIDKEKYSFSEVTKRIIDHDIPEDLNEFIHYYNALILEGYYDNVKDKIETTLLKTGSRNLDEYFQYQKKTGLMGKYLYYYRSIINKLDWSLLNE